MDGGLRRTRDKGGRVESRTAFRGELGRFKKGDMNCWMREGARRVMDL